MNYMDVLSIVLPGLAFVCVLLLLFVNIYSKLRPNKFVNVNCWFCNQWTKIPIEFWNSWDCPFCEQYNGFTPDGGYNKLIPAQHDELMNKLPLNVPTTAANNKILENGFCSTCNNNQQLKIQQLAMFSPLDDNNFDEEVEIYKEQLEQAYKLCAQCDTTLKNTLQKKKSLLLGIRLKTLKQQGLNYLNIKKSYHILSITAIKKKLLTFIRYATIILATIRLYEIVKNCDYSQETLNEILPQSILPFILVTKDLIVYIYYLQGIVVENCLSVMNTIKLSEYSYYFKNPTLLGFILQLVYLKTCKKRMTRDFTKLTSWLILLYLGNLTEVKIQTKLLEIFLCTLIIVIPSMRAQKIKINKKKNRKQIKDRSELLNEDVIKASPEILRQSTPEKIFGSNTTINENLFHVFGSTPVFENPLNTSYFKTQKPRLSPSIDLNGSLNSSTYSDNLNLNDSFIMSENPGNISTEFELNKCLSDLHLSTSKEKRHNTSSGGDQLLAAFRLASPFLMRPKPVLSPPKLQNVTQSSWVAGGYWKPNEFFNNFNGYSNLSRSSSQSSGFSSQASSQPFPGDNVFNSLPSSRTNSICGEFDRYSVFSEPAYPFSKTSPTMVGQQRFYSELRPDQQIYICPKPMNIYVQKSPPPMRGSFVSSPCMSRPSSRESIFTPTNLNLNTSFSNYSTCSASFKGSRSNFHGEPAFSKGSLLQKWREQLPNTIQNL